MERGGEEGKEGVYRHNLVNPVLDTFEVGDPNIRQDILQLIIQYLQSVNMNSAVQVLQDEANVQARKVRKGRRYFSRMKHSILNGDWQEADSLISKMMADSDKFTGSPYNKEVLKRIQYAIFKFQFLELIQRQESQKALFFLNKHLKPLEYLDSKNEFPDLCYLLSCKHVEDSPIFREYSGAESSRQRLADMLDDLIDLEGFLQVEKPIHELPPDRLVRLLQQSMAYQIEASPYDSNLRSRVTTLLEDYQSFVVPNSTRCCLTGHVGNVKSAIFLGDGGDFVISGSSDNTIKIWDINSSTCIDTLKGHTSRIWEVCTSRSGKLVASASSDCSVKVWNIDQENIHLSSCTNTLVKEDVVTDQYSVALHPTEKHLLSGGYDCSLHLWDIETGKLVQSMKGHTYSISSVMFNPLGNLGVTGSKDTTIKFWDLNSGVCIRSIGPFLGEVTGIDMNTSGSQVLSCSKDNSNRLWDIRINTGNAIQRYKGHQNTYKNFIKCYFGPKEAVILGGSENGMIYVWDTQSGKLLETLAGHQDIVYSSRYSKRRSLTVSCSDDQTVRVWDYKRIQNS